MGVGPEIPEHSPLTATKQRPARELVIYFMESGQGESKRGRQWKAVNRVIHEYYAKNKHDHAKGVT